MLPPARQSSARLRRRVVHRKHLHLAPIADEHANSSWLPEFHDTRHGT